MVEMQNPPGKEIRNLMTVLLSAMVFASMIAGFSLWYYSAMGEYFVRNVLLSPDVLDSVAYTEQKSRFTFDHIEFSYFDETRQMRKTFQIDRETYREIYKALARSKNNKPNEEVMNRFFHSNIAILSLYVRADGGGAQVFQEVQFSPNGDDFRIELRQEKTEDSWAYFSQKEILNQILTIIIPE